MPELRGWGAGRDYLPPEAGGQGFLRLAKPAMTGELVSGAEGRLDPQQAAQGWFVEMNFHANTKDAPDKVLVHEPDFPPGMDSKELERLLRKALAKGLVRVDRYRCPVARRDKEKIVVLDLDRGADGADAAHTS